MIIIFSYEGDRNTQYVIEWLNFYKCEYKRVHLEEEDSRNIKISLTNVGISITLKLFSGEIIDFYECDYFFVRGRGFKQPEIKNSTDLPDAVFSKYLTKEFNSLTKFFYAEVNKKAVGCFYNDAHLKLLQLRCAKEVGLSINNTLITNNKKGLATSFNHDKLITKAIEDNIGLNHDNKLIIQRVQKVDLKNLEDQFFPSLFQKEIGKEYEIRNFYLDGNCYSIRYKSRSNNVDMRDNYNESEYEPYKLPSSISDKVTLLMNRLNLLSGSLDFIKSTNGEYYFLEVNLNGQYDWVSYFGGYNLHQKIALFLKKQTIKQ
jgi:hypothetical protein